ncbi:MAG TPA: aminoacyl-tRNA hydrolase [Cycloclasticus sp.]|nr:aminoacyl-tRNA hydrolase [Cycloclasticus sp.]
MISLIVGLGNPGDEYKKTRHNAGFLLLDALAESRAATFSYDVKFKADIAKCLIGGKSVRLVKPQTFMNKSGLSVSACAHYFNVPVGQIMVVHDELDLDPGVIRFKCGGGHGGHNGLRDIASHMSSKDFYRLRVGIGHPGDRNKVSNYVLRAPNRGDRELIMNAVAQGVDEMPNICKGELQTAMQRLHTQ